MPYEWTAPKPHRLTASLPKKESPLPFYTTHYTHHVVTKVVMAFILVVQIAVLGVIVTMMNVFGQVLKQHCCVALLWFYLHKENRKSETSEE